MPLLARGARPFLSPPDVSGDPDAAKNAPVVGHLSTTDKRTPPGSFALATLFREARSDKSGTHISSAHRDA